MKREQKNNGKYQRRIDIWFSVSMFLAFVTVALVVNILIESDSWLNEAITGGVLSSIGLAIGKIIYSNSKNGSFLKDFVLVLFVFIILIDVGLIFCVIIQMNPKICTLSIAISYVIGLGMGEFLAVQLKQIQEEDNQEK